MREQTPPLLKWLLVERPTVAGNIVRIHERACLIDRELTRAQEQLAQLESEVARLQKQKIWLQQSLADEAARLAALDKSTGIASNDEVASNVVGLIRAHSVEYGKRGNLKSFIVGALQDFAPAPLSTLSFVHRKLDRADFKLSASIQ